MGDDMPAKMSAAIAVGGPGGAPAGAAGGEGGGSSFGSGSLSCLSPPMRKSNGPSAATSLLTRSALAACRAGVRRAASGGPVGHRAAAAMQSETIIELGAEPQAREYVISMPGVAYARP